MAQANYSINDTAFLMQIMENIQKSLGREFNDTEESDVLDYIIKNIPQQYFSQYTKNQISTIMTTRAIQGLGLAPPPRDRIIDTHEMLKQNLSDNTEEEQREIKEDNADNVEVNVDSILGIREVSTLMKKIREPLNSVNTAYMTLDSRYRIIEGDGTRFYKWGHINSITRGQGTVNSLGNIRHIVSLRLMAFRLPNTSSTNTFYKKISVLIEEFSPQAIIAHEDRRYHFIGEVEEVSADIINVDTDTYHKGLYKFNKPITSIDTITISLGSPLEPVILEPDRLTASVTSYASPTVIEFDADHNLLTGHTIYIENFSTKNPAFDKAIIQAMNSQTGNAVTVTTATEVTIAVDSADIIVAVAGTITAPSTTLVGTVTATRGSTIISGTGTSFTVDFAVGDYIDILGTPSAIYQIASIESATSLTLTTNYQEFSGTYGYRITGKTIVGAGSDFLDTLNIGDNIIIADGGSSPEFTVESIESNTSLTITTPYNGLDGAGFAVTKDNSLDTPLRVFLGSKRVFFELEATYLASRDI